MDRQLAYLVAQNQVRLYDCTRSVTVVDADADDFGVAVVIVFFFFLV